MAADRKNAKPTLAGVGDYPERPLKDALAKPADIAKAEGEHVDQDPDYHKKHPTLNKRIPQEKIEELQPDNPPVND